MILVTARSINTQIMDSYQLIDISFYFHNGDFDKSRLVCHTCDNRLCVNPSHLYLGDELQNARDREQRHRRNINGIRNGKKYSN